MIKKTTFYVSYIFPFPLHLITCGEELVDGEENRKAEYTQYLQHLQSINEERYYTIIIIPHL